MTAAATSVPTEAAVRGGRLPVVVYALLCALCVALYVPGFVSIPPFDRDEARFAQASSQMLESGDLVDIRFQDEPRYKKPIGIYWLQAASTTLIDGPDGRHIWTYRLPSLLGATLAVLLTAWAGARLFSPATGVMAAIMLASCVVLGVEARMAKTDAVLLATIVAAQALLAHVYVTRDRDDPGWRPAMLFWVAVGISILIKGPIVVLVSGCTAAGLALWDRRAGWLRRLRPATGLAVAALIAAPWLLAIALKTGGAFFSESVGHDMLGKVASGQEGKGLPPGYFLGTVWVTFAPWTILAMLAAPWAWANRRDAAVRFCLVWIVPSWLVFEAVPTKLLHYTLPVFPALALLSARAALDHFGRTEERRRPWLFAAAAALGGLGVAGLCAGVAGLPLLADGRFEPLAAGFAVLAAILFFAAVRAVWQRREGRAVTAGLGAAALLYVGAYAFVLPQVQTIWVSRLAARLVTDARPCPTTTVAAAGYSEPSLVFLLGTATRIGHAAEAAAHLRADPACALALVEGRQEAAFHAALQDAAPTALGQAEGFNYSNGRRVALTLYRLDAAGPAAAAR